MRILFVGIFIIALLAGILGKIDKHSSSTWVGDFLNAVGLKQREQVQKVQVDQIVSQFSKERSTLWDELRDQQEYLRSSREQMGSLYQMVKDRSDRDANVDLLRLKELMKEFQDQSTILIEHGKQLEEFNRSRIKVNQDLALKSDVDQFISNSDRNRFLQNIKDKLDEQKQFIDQQMQRNSELKDKIHKIQDHINQMHDNIAFKENPELVEKLKSLSTKTKTVLDQVKEKQEKLQAMNQKNLASLDVSREKMADMKEKSRSQTTSQRIQDQIQKLKDQRSDRMK